MLIKANGGTLCKNVVESSSASNILEDAPIVECEIGSLLEFEQLAYGHYSPLNYFPGNEERKKIYYTGSLINGQMFPIPPLFAVPSSQAEGILLGEIVKVQYNGNIIGYLEVHEISTFGKNEKEEYCRSIFQTTDSSHPGVAYILSLGETLLAGKPTLFAGEGIFAEGGFLTAEKMRLLFNEKKISRVCAFSTTNVPHRAHEFLIRQALETQDAVLIHALHVIGKKGSAKYPLDIVRKSYDSLCKNYLPRKKLLFAVFPSLVRSAGPRSSLLQAIIRQNYGCTHQIYGRDHEGFSSLYGKYDSQKAVSSAKGIQLRPLCLSGPYYCNKCAQITSENSCTHSQDSEKRVDISGTKIRQLLENGKTIPPIFLREEISLILREYYLNKK